METPKSGRWVELDGPATTVELEGTTLRRYEFAVTKRNRMAMVAARYRVVVTHDPDYPLHPWVVRAWTVGDDSLEHLHSRVYTKEVERGRSEAAAKRVCMMFMHSLPQS